MTARRLIATIGDVKVYRDADWNEFRVVFPCGSTAHTDDKAEALAIARVDARRTVDAIPRLSSTVTPSQGADEPTGPLVYGVAIDARCNPADAREELIAEEGDFVTATQQLKQAIHYRAVTIDARDIPQVAA